MCKRICPAINEVKINNREKPKTLAAHNKEEEDLKNSTSGGIFSVLADYVIENNGVVYGAAMNENLELQHIKAETKDEYKKMRGSKYIQSKIGNSYNEIKAYLEQNRTVLFVGCPCQVAGLYAFLGKKVYENLITADLVCHGVGSKLFFDKYIKEMEKKYDDKIVGISFRSKKNGYTKFTTELILKNHKPIYIKALNDSYMSVYMKYGIYRESCYKCKFAKIPRVGDFTLGDFKGIKNEEMQKKIEKGISVILLNNEKADKIFAEIVNKVEYVERPLNEATSTNRNITKPTIRPNTRDVILKEEGNTKQLQKKYFKRKIKEYIADALGYKVMRKIKK